MVKSDDSRKKNLGNEELRDQPVFRLKANY